MTFFGEPEHLWLAVVVMAGTGVLCTFIFVLAVRIMLDRFFDMARGLLEKASIQADSIDLSITLHSQRLTQFDERITKLERHRHDHANLITALDDRLRHAKVSP